MGVYNYIIKGIRRLANSPGSLPRDLRYELNYLGRRINNQYYRALGAPSSYDLPSEDWDTAIILDACRYDTFRDYHTFTNGTLKKKFSPGSTSKEYFKRSFGDDLHHDIVYVTANPYISSLDNDTFHATYFDELWKNDSSEPERTTNAALQAHSEHPHKRIIVHYMQPHLPIKHPEYSDINEHIQYWRGQYFPQGTTIELLRTAYISNLKHICSYVSDLISEINGKIIITSDHGELLGERQRPLPIRGFNHHEQLYMDELVEVPWFEISGKKREIKPDPPSDKINVTEEWKKERLQALGYL